MFNCTAHFACVTSHTIFTRLPSVVSLVNYRVYMCAFVTPAGRRPGACARCGRTTSRQGKCSYAAASLWRANRAFLSADRAVPVHAALRETGGLQHSSGKFWDQQITAALQPLTCRHWAAPFSLRVPLQPSLSLPLCDLQKHSLHVQLYSMSIVFLL